MNNEKLTVEVNIKKREVKLTGSWYVEKDDRNFSIWLIDLIDRYEKIAKGKLTIKFELQNTDNPAVHEINIIKQYFKSKERIKLK